MSGAEHPFPWSEDAVCRPSAEKDAARIPPDCWPTCEYGVECPHEWRVLPPATTEDPS